MKGISPVIATILMVMITVGLVAFSYNWFMSIDSKEVNISKPEHNNSSIISLRCIYFEYYPIIYIDKINLDICKYINYDNSFTQIIDREIWTSTRELEKKYPQYFRDGVDKTSIREYLHYELNEDCIHIDDSEKNVYCLNDGSKCMIMDDNEVCNVFRP